MISEQAYKETHTRETLFDHQTVYVSGIVWMVYKVEQISEVGGGYRYV